MQVSVATEVWLLFAIIGVIWSYVRFSSLPRAHQNLVDSYSDNISKEGAHLAGLQMAEALFRGAIIALGLIILIAIGLDLYANSQPQTEQGLANLVASRDMIETSFAWALSLGVWIWITILVIVGLIWWFLAQMQSMKRWDTAVEARRTALLAALSDTEPQELESIGANEIPDRMAAIENDIANRKSANAAYIEETRNLPMLRFGDQGDELSLIEMQMEIGYMRDDARKYHEDGQEEHALILEQRADKFEEQLRSIIEDMDIELHGLQNSRKVSLADAINDPEGHFDWQSDKTEALRTAIIADRLESHRLLGETKGRAEPELWHEWVGTVATSEVSIKGLGWMARHARSVTLIAFFIGFLGFGASADSSDFIEDSAKAEMEMVLAIGDQEINASATSAKAELAQNTELASDEQTELRLRKAMRSNLASNLLRGVTRGRKGAALDALQQAGLKGMGARENLLSNASRPAAKPFEGGGGKAAQISPDFPEGGRVGDNLDEIFDRRIQQLKSKPGVWNKLRASAAKPAKLDLISSQFLSATLSDNDFTRSKAFRAAADRSTAKFAAKVAETGDIPRNMENWIPDMHNPALYSGRDQRLFSDFQREAPGRVKSRLSAVRSGNFRIGSLFRAVPSLNGSRMTRGFSGGRYDSVFPDGAKTRGMGFATGITNKVSPNFRSGGGGGGRTRFRMRRKGVILGQQPDNSEAVVPLEIFEWTANGGNVTFTLKSSKSDKITLGPFDSETVSTALAFAADGRPDLVSLPRMIFQQGDEVLDEMNQITSRIVLHPAIGDTDLACNAVGLDRFVDIFMKADMARKGTGSLLEAWHANVELSYLADSSAQKSDIDVYAKNCGIGNKCFPIDQYSKAGLNLSGYQSYLNCQASGQGQCTPMASLDTNGFAMTTIVEEQHFKIDPNLTFLKNSGDNNELWPFRFTMRAIPLSMTGEDMNLGENFSPWDFPAAQPLINKMIKETLAVDAPSNSIFKRMRDFTILQRMFRLALEGRFGAEFPYDSLVALQDATNDAITIIPSGNWDLYPVYNGRQEKFSAFMNAQAEKITTDLKLLSEEGSSAQCKAFATLMRAKHVLEPLPQRTGFWLEIGKIGEMCGSQQNNGYGVGGSVRRINSLLDKLREQDLIEDAIMLGKGGFNTEFLVCPAR